MTKCFFFSNKQLQNVNVIMNNILLNIDFCKFSHVYLF